MFIPGILVSLTLAMSTSTGGEVPLLIPPSAAAAVHISRPDQVLPPLNKILKKAATLNQKDANSRRATAPATYLNRLFAQVLQGANILDDNNQSLTSAHFDVTKPITLSMVRGQWVACLYALPESDSFDVLPHSKETAADLTSVQERHGTIRFLGAADRQGRWRRGAAISGNTVCTTSGPSDAKSILKEAATVFQLTDSSVLPTSKKLSATSMNSADELRRVLARQNSKTSRRTSHFSKISPKDAIQAVFPLRDTLVQLEVIPSKTADSLSFTGIIPGGGVAFAKTPPHAQKPDFVKIDTSPISSIEQSSTVWIEASLAPQALSEKGLQCSLLRRVARQLTPNLPSKDREVALTEFLNSLVGTIRLAILKLDGKEPASSLHQVRHAIFARVKKKHIPTMEKALANLSKGFQSSQSSPSLSPATPGGFVSILAGKPVWFGLKDQSFYFANDLDFLQESLHIDDSKKRPTARFSPTAPAIDLRFIGHNAPRSLAPISIFDMVNGSLSGALFVLKTEAMGLISNAQLVTRGTSDGRDLKFDGRLSLGESNSDCPCKQKSP